MQSLQIAMFSYSAKNKEYFVEAKSNLYRLLCFVKQTKIKSILRERQHPRRQSADGTPREWWVLPRTCISLWEIPTGVAFSSRKIAKCNLYRLLCFLVQTKIKSMFSCSAKIKSMFYCSDQK